MILFDNCRYLIATPTPDGVIEGGWVLVDGPLIRSVGGPEESPKDEMAVEGVEVVDCSGKLVMPGMIDSHNHLANYPYNLLPGIDPSSMDFRGISECLEKLIWPAYTWATDGSTYDLTMLAMCNAIQHGTTTITSAFPWPDATYGPVWHRESARSSIPRPSATLRSGTAWTTTATSLRPKT